MNLGGTKHSVHHSGETGGVRLSETISRPSCALRACVHACVYTSPHMSTSPIWLALKKKKRGQDRDHYHNIRKEWMEPDLGGRSCPKSPRYKVIFWTWCLPPLSSVQSGKTNWPQCPNLQSEEEGKELEIKIIQQVFYTSLLLCRARFQVPRTQGWTGSPALPNLTLEWEMHVKCLGCEDTINFQFMLPIERRSSGQQKHNYLFPLIKSLPGP